MKVTLCRRSWSVTDLSTTDIPREDNLEAVAGDALLLSLCIPTYNRVAFLKEALDVILQQWASDLLEPDRRRIEVVISDNASQDGTTAMVARLGVTYPALRLRIVCQPENRGSDANILQALRLGRGEYACLLSDDDVLLPGALASMLSLIRENPGVDAFCLNSRSFALDPGTEITTPDFGVEEDQLILNRDQCLRFVGTRITFITLLLFRRPPVTPPSYEIYIGTSLLQAYLYLDILARGGMYVTRQVFLAVRTNNTGGYNFFEVFVSHFADVMRYARTLGYSQAAIRAVHLRHITQFLAPFIAVFKLRGSYGGLMPDFQDGIRRLLKEYGPHPVLIFGLIPLMLGPPGLSDGIRRIIRCLRSGRE